jgi:methionine sulfoxide reductase heme-binding subunit
MAWLRIHWRWAALNLFALGFMIYVFRQVGRSWRIADYDPVLESGKWAVRFLLLCLTISPLNTYFGWRNGIPLRKPAGLWAFGFASLHVGLLLTEIESPGLSYLTLPMQPFIALGLSGLTILSALAITSNQRAMRWLGKRWKRLHRLVYAAGVAVILHAVLAGESKRIMLNDPDVIYELNLYAVILAVLLALRIGFVRGAIQQLKHIPMFSLRRGAAR